MQENIATASKVTVVSDGASSSSAPEERKYEVFLNFRGTDTRKKFTDHLYETLTKAGICTFRDEEELDVGKEIGSELINAIQESTILIPIFSKEYASSKWCLRELTEMVKCNKKKTQTICPIFYDVTPSEVKHQTGSFEAAFRDVDADSDIILEWKRALSAVAEIKGWEKDQVRNGYEGALVTSIVEELCRMLGKNNVRLPDKLMRMDRHVEEMEKMMDVKGSGVRIVGIHGMVGIGKTTVAKYMYNQLCECDHFQQCSFLENIREKAKQENSYDGLKNQLISDILKRKPDGTIFNKKNFKNMKVLIVLDDVEERCELNEFIGSLDWFGSGSRIIVTTRNLEVLKELRRDHIYRLSEMNFDDSHALFCEYAFGSVSPSQGFEELSKEVVLTAAGLPLSLMVTGSSLFSKEKREWEDTLKSLKTVQPGQVLEKLKTSYEALEGREMKIFLDIACHFIGQDKRLPTLMWEDCGFLPGSGLRRLVALCLITLEDDNILRMHNHFRDLGRSIVSQGNQSDRGEDNRFWSQEDAVRVLNPGLGKTVQTFCFQGDHRFRAKHFRKSLSLRYLHLEGSKLKVKGNFGGLLPELRWFRWRVGNDSFELENFCPSKLIILDLSGSDIKDDWDDKIQIKSAINLKVLNLSDCHHITKTPNFSTPSSLERLILRNCPKLTKIHPSVKHLKCLNYINATDCRSLKGLPSDFGSMEALKEVYLDSSFKLRNDIEVFLAGFGNAVASGFGSTQRTPNEAADELFGVTIPDQFWDLKSLVELGLSGIRIRKKLSEDIGKLKNLRSLILRSSNIKRLPNAIGRLENLEVLDLSDSKVETLPNAIGNLGNLRKLNLRNAAVNMIPVDIAKLSKLEELDCSETLLVGELPAAVIRRLSSLRVLNLGGTKISVLSLDISASSLLVTLDLGFCDFRFTTDLQLPQSLKTLCVPLNEASFNSLTGLLNLTTLRFTGGGSTGVEYPTCMSRLPESIELRFAGPHQIISPDNLSQLKVLEISKCEHLQWISDLSHLTMLRELSVEGCPILSDMGDFQQLFLLEHILIRECKSLEQLLPNLAHLKSLKTLNIFNCKNLRRIQGLEELTTLERLTLHACPFSRNVPDLSKSRSVKIEIL